MSDIQCPHCHAEVSRGASVCQGCQAEVEYGIPRAAIVFVLLVSIFAAWYVGSSTLEIVGWVVFVVLLVAGLFGCNRIFRERISFKRIYRTR